VASGLRTTNQQHSNQSEETERCKCNDAQDPFQFHYLLNKNKITILTTDLLLSLFLGKHSMASASCPAFRPFLQA